MTPWQSLEALLDALVDVEEPQLEVQHGLSSHAKPKMTGLDDASVDRPHRNLEDVLRWFEAAVQLYVGEMCEDLVFVHAGVVSWRGQAIIVPGRSFSGKTTLVRSLVRAGAEYYSDEYAVFDRHGRVHPYPRPLGVRSLRDETRRRCTIQELNGVCGTRPLPASLVVATHYVPGATWRPRRLSPGRAALLLFANAVAARRKPDFALDTLRKVVSGAVALESPRDEAENMSDMLFNELPEPDRETQTQMDRRELCFPMQGRTN